jgi:ribosomal protein S2
MNLSDTVSTLSNERLTSQNEISRLSKLTQELGEQLKQKEVANQSVKQEKEKLERNLGDFKMMNNKKDESSQIMLKRIDDG